MLPPVPEETLSANPLFKALYEDLTTKILNPEDLTSRSALRDHRVLDQELRTHRAELAKTQLLQRELETVTCGAGSASLPDELQEIIDLAITAPRTPALDLPLLSATIDDFHASLPLIGEAISRSLAASALDIAKIAYPEDSNPLLLDSKLDHLPADAAHRRKTLLHTTAALTAQRSAVTALTQQVLSAHHTLTTLSLHHTHSGGGVLAAAQGAAAARAAHMAVVASSMEGKLGVLRAEAVRAVYDDAAVEALANYGLHLQDTRARLLARQRTVEGELERYAKAGSDMVGLVERYGAVMRGIEAVGRDIVRLGGRV
ncbi:hypothetical protein DFP73DRAFT_546204 [Morchella snyderi]|nr:hypothetical protein DFP73DRAFT_546204 [Morchella snyderi]